MKTVQGLALVVSAAAVAASAEYRIADLLPLLDPLLLAGIGMIAAGAICWWHAD